MGSLWDGEICRSSAAIARIALIGVVACAAPAPAPPPRSIGNVAPGSLPAPVDPAQIEGRWTYQAWSDCRAGEGTGWVDFRWDPDDGSYRERGEVTWPAQGITDRWTGTARVVH